MTYAQLSPARMTGTPGSLGLQRLAQRLIGPFKEAHRRLLLRQQFESLSDRQLADIGVAREDIAAVVRECWIEARGAQRQRSDLRPASGAGGLRGR